MDHIFQGISHVRETIFPGQEKVCERLVRDGQRPQALFIACADSRVPAEDIAQSGSVDLIASGSILACGGDAGRFVPIEKNSENAVAQASSTRLAAPEIANARSVAVV